MQRDILSRLQLKRTPYLPYDLLVEIFLVCFQLEMQDPSYLDQLPTPLLLGQVCSEWRRIVHATPKLWTHFSLNIRSNVGRGVVDHASFAKAWLFRAHQLPLYVSLHDFTFGQNKVLTYVLDSILASADRLRHIQLHLPLQSLRCLVGIATESMTILESVHLTVMGWDLMDNYEPWMTQITAFSTAPRLHRVTLDSSPSWLSFYLQLPMPWSQLTELSILGARPITDEFRDAFLQCTNLVDCTLNLDSWERAVPDVPIVVFPHLRRLITTIHGPGLMSLFFQPFKAPALKVLTIQIQHQELCDWSHQIFMEFASRSSLNLERFSLGHMKLLSNELLDLLLPMNSLIELKIRYSLCIDDDLFDALQYRETNVHQLVPNLKTLDIIFFRGEYIDCDGIADMIESRWWTDDAPRAVSRLERVAMVFNYAVRDNGWRARLAHCREEGLELDLG